MKKNRVIRAYNLIEVTMAIAVVGIGIGGIMALFPPAINANKSADFNNYTGELVGTMASYIETQLKLDWRFSIPTANTTNDTFDTLLQYLPTDTWTAVTGLNGIFTITKSGTDISNANGIYGIRSGDGSVMAHIRIWQTTPDADVYYYYTSPPNTGSRNLITTGNIVSNDNRRRIIIELSWPVGASYANRNTKEFVYEFYNR